MPVLNRGLIPHIWVNDDFKGTKDILTRLAHMTQGLLGDPALLVGVLGRQGGPVAPGASEQSIDSSPRSLLAIKAANSVHKFESRFRYLNYMRPVCR